MGSVISCQTPRSCSEKQELSVDMRKFSKPSSVMMSFGSFGETFAAVYFLNNSANWVSFSLDWSNHGLSTRHRKWVKDRTHHLEFLHKPGKRGQIEFTTTMRRNLSVYALEFWTTFKYLGEVLELSKVQVASIGRIAFLPSISAWKTGIFWQRNDLEQSLQIRSRHIHIQSLAQPFHVVKIEDLISFDICSFPILTLP